MTGGLNLHVYASTLTAASRMKKLSCSLQDHLGFDESHLVGMSALGLPSRQEIAPGVLIVRVAASSRSGSIGRVLKALFWQPMVYRRYRKAEIAVVAAHNVWLLPMCAQLSRKTGAVLVYNAHELETETIAMHGLRQRVARWIEARYLPRAKVISVVNESIADWYEQRYGGNRPVVVENVPLVRSDPSHLRERLGIDLDQMLYIHTGNLVHRRNIPLILETFARHPDQQLVFLGEGHLCSVVQDFAERYGNIHWLPPVPADTVAAEVRDADVGLCLIENEELSYQLSSPNKLLEALAVGTPALCSNLTEARRLLGGFAGAWILNDPAVDLDGAIERIGKREVTQFRSSWPGVPSWSQQVEPLVAAYEAELRLGPNRG